MNKWYENNFSTGTATAIAPVIATYSTTDMFAGALVAHMKQSPLPDPMDKVVDAFKDLHLACVDLKQAWA